MQLVEQRSISRNNLYDQVWSTPMSKLCQQYGLSDNGLRKICKRFDIPMPMRGHWAKLQHGKKVRQTVLPPSEYGEYDEILRVSPSAANDNSLNSVQAAANHEKQPENRNHVPEILADPLPVIERTRKSLFSAKPDEDGLVQPRARSCLDVKVSRDQVDRAMLIADTLLKALRERGIDVVEYLEDKSIARIELEGDSVWIAMVEQLDCHEPPLTAKERQEKKEYPWMHSQPNYTYSLSGRLMLQIGGGNGGGCQRSWRDTTTRRLDRCLNSFIAGLHRVADANRQEGERAERREREWAVRRERWEEEERRKREDKALLDDLDERLLRWRECEDIRAICTAFEERANTLGMIIHEGSELEKWLNWARQRANALDPVQLP